MSLIQVREKAQITIPSKIRKELGIKKGDYLEIASEGGRIILIPKIIEDKFLTDKEWCKLNELVKRQRRQRKYTRYTNSEEAKKHSRELMK